jgi:hypothetical protein
MQFKPAKAQPMSEETSELGRQFVNALLLEGHEYASIKANFLALLANAAVREASKKLARVPGAVLETSGIVRGSMSEAAKNLRMTRQGFRKLFHGAESMAAR